MRPALGSTFSIMYHYIEREPQGYVFNALSREQFVQQLDFLEDSFGILSSADWSAVKNGEMRSGCLLTFDDGLKSHIQEVAPILKKRNLFAMFFVNSDPINFKKSMVVHQVHWLLKNFSILDLNGKLLTIDPNYKTFQNSFKSQDAYKGNSDSELINGFKYYFNYFRAQEDISETLPQLLEQCFFSEELFCRDWYMTDIDVVNLRTLGFGVGSHGTDHNLLTSLSLEKLKENLMLSRRFLKSLLNTEIDEFCYPYGGPSAVDLRVTNAVASAGYSFAHAVEDRNLLPSDIDSRFRLPRFDCNVISRLL